MSSTTAANLGFRSTKSMTGAVSRKSSTDVEQRVGDLHGVVSMAVPRVLVRLAPPSRDPRLGVLAAERMDYPATDLMPGSTLANRRFLPVRGQTVDDPLDEAQLFRGFQS